MEVRRRGFLIGGIAGVAVAAGPRSSEAEPAAAKARLRLSSQHWLIPGKSLEEKFERMQKWGIEGVEVGADAVGNPKKYLDALKNTDLKVSAICFGSMGGAFVSENPERRKQGEEQLKRAARAAGELGARAVVFVPAFNRQTKLPHHEIRKVLVDRLPAVGEVAAKAGTHIVLEPLNRREAYFLRLVADAAAIARDCKSPGIGAMADFYHMAIEETSDLGAIISGGKFLHHVHLASRKRVLPGQDERSFVEGFLGLQMIGYQGFCSFECGCRGDKMVEFPKSVAFLKNQWAKAAARS